MAPLYLHSLKYNNIGVCCGLALIQILGYLEKNPVASNVVSHAHIIQ